MDMFTGIEMAAKVGLIVFVMLQVVPMMVWIERRGSALMQNRRGPNRVGPLGLFQSLADVVKFIFKEDMVPEHCDKFYYILAPAVVLLPAFMTFAVVPFGGDITIAGHVVHLQVADLNVGFLYILSIGSLGVYGIIMAGWSSNNKYSLLGSLRSSAQMISYELSMGLSLVGIVMIYSSFELREIVFRQTYPLMASAPGILAHIPKWGFFVQPVGFIIFLSSVYAETNRLPFDLPEGESEIVAGYHLEFGSMRFALFFMAEYLNMVTASALLTTLYFGGYSFPGLHIAAEAFTPLVARASEIASSLMPFVPTLANPDQWARAILEVAVFSAKVGFFMWLFVWVRWTLPRFRYDQLMDLGWKVFLPLSIANIAVTGVLIYLGVI
ncbi:MAG: NADH-quinone oxidoreductase subunit NuoH [Deltaproteobacteria bacterium]|nr:NADH-quinone oxidoreductase subunit NuoH [Deltaproteobacteria bacterium]